MVEARVEAMEESRAVARVAVARAAAVTAEAVA